MNILHINTHDIQGGAARAAYRLHRALLTEGVNSQMLVSHKLGDDDSVIAPTSTMGKASVLVRHVLDGLPVKRYPNRTQTLFSPAWVPFSQVPAQIAAINPDIVHLHWVCGGMLSVADLAKIKQPIVWSLHDMWAFTGGEHYDEEQAHYLDQCGMSKVLGSDQQHDLSRRGWQKKQHTYNKINSMMIVGLSQWLSDCAKQSSLLKNKQHICLPNPMDTRVFAPFDKTRARELFHLPGSKKLVLFGAMGATSDPRKGFAQLHQALVQLQADDVALVVFGSSQPKQPPDFKQPVHYLGHLHDDVSLRLLYSAADVMVVPSLQENLSNAIMESLACATPVVAFDVGGNGDMIEHQHNGYLAKPFDAQDLAAGIDWVLNTADYRQVSDNARDKVLTCFDSKVVAKQYIELYKEVLAQS